MPSHLNASVRDQLSHCAWSSRTNWPFYSTTSKRPVVTEPNRSGRKVLRRRMCSFAGGYMTTSWLRLSREPLSLFSNCSLLSCTVIKPLVVHHAVSPCKNISRYPLVFTIQRPSVENHGISNFMPRYTPDTRSPDTRCMHLYPFVSPVAAYMYPVSATKLS